MKGVGSRPGTAFGVLGLSASDHATGLLQSVSELVISLVLIALGFGWTLGLESQVFAATMRMTLPQIRG